MLEPEKENMLTLIQGLQIVLRQTRTKSAEHWFREGVEGLRDFIGKDVYISEITPQHIRNWYEFLNQKLNENLARLGNRKLSAWSVDSYARSVKAFMNHMVRMGHIEKSPFQLRLPKLPKKAKKSIPQNDIELMVQYSEDNRRDHAIVLMLRDSGCRVSELCSVTLSNLKIKRFANDGKARWELKEGEELPAGATLELRGSCLVLGKMNKKRWIHFGHQACVAIKAYLRVRPRMVSADYLFLSTEKQSMPPQTAYSALRRVANLAGVPKFNPHSFRHALAEKLLKDEVPIRVIQEILGHADSKTTMDMYMVIDDEELEMFHQKYVRFRDVKSLDDDN